MAGADLETGRTGPPARVHRDARAMMRYDNGRMFPDKETWLFVALLTTASACAKNEEDPECRRYREHARSAASKGELERAAEALAEARKRCGPKWAQELQRTERLIDERAELRREVARREAERAAEREGTPAKRFLSWIAEEGSTPTKNLASIRCAERGSPDFGFCEAERPGAPEMKVRYWERERSAFRYSLTTEQPLSCLDFGEHRRVRTWSRGSESYELCESTQHDLRGLSALLVRAPAEHQMFVFSQSYLQKDRDFERIVAGQH